MSQPEPAHDAELVGLDNVRIELPIAGLGNRVLAAFLDHVLLGVLTIVLFFVAGVVAAILRSGGMVLALLMILPFLITWGGFAMIEIAMRGQTPGKRALELRVISAQGGAASTSALIIRNLLRVIDIWVGVILIGCDPKARRLGDRLAGTLVIHERKRQPRLILGRTPAAWGARETAVVQSFVERAEQLETNRAQEVARRIIAWVARDAPEMLDGDDDRRDPVVRVRLVFKVESL